MLHVIDIPQILVKSINADKSTLSNGFILSSILVQHVHETQCNASIHIDFVRNNMKSVRIIAECDLCYIVCQ